jgi:hypothetical protein
MAGIESPLFGSIFTFGLPLETRKESVRSHDSRCWQAMLTLIFKIING